LKDRVADVSDFVDALVRVGSGGTALDPEVVTPAHGRVAPGRLHRRTEHPEKRCSPSWPRVGQNGAIADALVIFRGNRRRSTVASIFTKLHLPESQSDHRRVLAVLPFLDRGPSDIGERTTILARGVPQLNRTTFVSR